MEVTQTNFGEHTDPKDEYSDKVYQWSFLLDKNETEDDVKNYINIHLAPDYISPYKSFLDFLDDFDKTVDISEGLEILSLGWSELIHVQNKYPFDTAQYDDLPDKYIYKFVKPYVKMD